MYFHPMQEEIGNLSDEEITKLTKLWITSSKD